MAKNDEAALQAAIVTFVRTVSPDVLIFHPPNGGLRSKREAAKLKWMGVVAGIPDLILWYDNGKTACWEVKMPGRGLSKDQGLVASWLELSGFPWFLIRSIDDARDALAELGIETRESTNDHLDRGTHRQARGFVEKF